jgi:hypothetical protein
VAVSHSMPLPGMSSSVPSTCSSGATASRTSARTGAPHNPC